VRDDALVVLGLVTTKTPRRETVSELVERVRQASTFVPLERLAVGTQCGFATSIVGNAISVEDEAAKLRVLAETAGEVWP
jgi:5-methyltetrahydropteroyltriglutamate--homocysteine methyltransferase